MYTAPVTTNVTTTRWAALLLAIIPAITLAQESAEVITDPEAIRAYADQGIMRDREDRPYRRLSTRKHRSALNQQKLQLQTLWAEYDKVDDRLDALILQLLSNDTPALRTEFDRVSAQKRRIRALIRQTTANIDALDYEFKQAVD